MVRIYWKYIFFIPLKSNTKHHNFWIYIYIYFFLGVSITSGFIKKKTSLWGLFFNPILGLWRYIARFYVLFLPPHVPSPFQAFFSSFQFGCQNLSSWYNGLACVGTRKRMYGTGRKVIMSRRWSKNSFSNRYNKIEIGLIFAYTQCRGFPLYKFITLLCHLVLGTLVMQNMGCLTPETRAHSIVPSLCEV